MGIVIVDNKELELADGVVDDGATVVGLRIELVLEAALALVLVGSFVTVSVLTTVTGDAVVCVWSTDTTEMSVLVTVAVEVSDGGVTVTVVSCVVVTVAVVVVDEEPPSMGTTEYVSRGRKAWKRGRWSTTGASARGAHDVRPGKARRRESSGAGRFERRIVTCFEGRTGEERKGVTVQV